MNIYIKRVKNTQGGIIETLWVNYTVNGKRFRKSLELENTKANYKRAENEILPMLKYKLMNGELNTHNKKIPTVHEYMNFSFELHSGNRSKSTIYGHIKNYDKYLKNDFGHKSLDKVKASEITLWQNKLQKEYKLSKSYILKIRGLLFTMFEDAIENEIIKINPVKKAKGLKQTEDTKVKRLELTPFKPDEINKILSVATNQDKNLVATLFMTGLRIGECLGLSWDCVDFKNRTLTVKKQIVNGQIKNILKTSKSKRIIPIIEALNPFLENQKKLTGEKNSFLFLTKKTNKHYHSAGKIREQIWVKTLKKANVEYRNLHQTRGTFISTLISNGEDINYVSKIAGHENVKITLERYSQYIPIQNMNFGSCFKKIQTLSDTELAPKKNESI
ncbi:site-specific integrase [Aliarcobacter butzleri]|uniref:site-specific integrase n=1 Tax=Aliarcobacter butzleri TaxID=28197 RepID=UPI0021B2ADBB|nr:site-specific integrase [Aliarcobacter butzleri]MCT7602279.1 site-specific integrase [Aliarcobacter butzleri]